MKTRQQQLGLHCNVNWLLSGLFLINSSTISVKAKLDWQVLIVSFQSLLNLGLWALFGKLPEAEA